MAGENPLVAASPAESGSFFTAGTGDNGWATGFSLAESAMDTFNGIKDGDWITAGLGVVGLAADAAAMAVDPFGTLMSSVASFLMEHMQPLKEMLDWLAGNPPVIESYSTTWGNVATELGKISEDYGNAVKSGTQGWTGPAAELYLKNSRVHGDALAGAASAAGTVGTVVGLMGMVVAFVRELVRDLIADLVGKLIAWVLETVFSLGFGTPVVVAQAITAISKWAAKIAKVIQDLLDTIKRVSPMLKRLVEIFEKIMKVVGKLAGKATGLDVLDPKNIKRGGFLQTGNHSVDTPSGGTHPSSSSRPDPDAPDAPGTTRTSRTDAPEGETRGGPGTSTTTPSSVPGPGTHPNGPQPGSTPSGGTQPGSPRPGSTHPGSPQPGSPQPGRPQPGTAPSHAIPGPGTSGTGTPGHNTPLGETRGGPGGNSPPTHATPGPGTAGSAPTHATPGPGTAGGNAPSHTTPGPGTSGGNAPSHATPGPGTSGGSTPSHATPGPGTSNPTTPSGNPASAPTPRHDQTHASTSAPPDTAPRTTAPPPPSAPTPHHQPGQGQAPSVPTHAPGGGGAPGGSPTPSSARPGSGAGWTGTPGHRGDLGSGTPPPRTPAQNVPGQNHPGQNHPGQNHPGQNHPGPASRPGPTAPQHPAAGRPNPGSTAPSHAGPNHPNPPGHTPPGTPGPHRAPSGQPAPGGHPGPGRHVAPAQGNPTAGPPRGPQAGGPPGARGPHGPAESPRPDAPAPRHAHDDPPGHPDRPGDPGHTPEHDRPGIDEAHARHGEVTPAGVSHHRGDSDMGDLPSRVPHDPRYFTADVHITPDGRAHIGGHSYSPEEYGDLLRRNGWDGRTPIRLIGCDAGANDFANRLSRHTGADVLAPTRPAWTDSRGRVYTSDAEIGPDGNRRPRIPPNGEWETHRPDGTRARTGDDGFVPGTREHDKHDLDPADARDRARALPPVHDSPDRNPSPQHRAEWDPPTHHDGRPLPEVPLDVDPTTRISDFDGREPLRPNARHVVTDTDGRPRGVFYTDGDRNITHVEANVSNTGFGTNPARPAVNPDIARPLPGVTYHVDRGVGHPSVYVGRTPHQPLPSGPTPDATPPAPHHPDQPAPQHPPQRFPEFDQGATPPAVDWNPPGDNGIYHTADPVTGYDARGAAGPFSLSGPREPHTRYDVYDPDGNWHGTFYTDANGDFSHVHTWSGNREHGFNPELGTSGTANRGLDVPRPNTTYAVGPRHLEQHGLDPREPRQLFRTDEHGLTEAASGRPHYPPPGTTAPEHFGSRRGFDSDGPLQTEVGHIAGGGRDRAGGHVPGEYQFDPARHQPDDRRLFRFAGGHLVPFEGGGPGERINHVPQWAYENSGWQIPGGNTADTWRRMEHDLADMGARPGVSVDRIDIWSERHTPDVRTPDVLHADWSMSVTHPVVISITEQRSFQNVPPPSRNPLFGGPPRPAP
ncbi:hypothetical protein [Actinosynnema sp. NPDC020468]|uniref:hypothetical protein n=1 Tax=Actinosynnema sp. NPDC020468 TaxID=3154488 RepID=UPI0033F12BFB